MRDPKHLQFIRSLPCCVCGQGPSEAAHIRKGVPYKESGGMGMKSFDKWAVPLCRICHDKEHKGMVTFWGDMEKPVKLAAALYADPENAHTIIVKWRRENDIRNDR